MEETTKEYLETLSPTQKHIFMFVYNILYKSCELDIKPVPELYTPKIKYL